MTSRAHSAGRRPAGADAARCPAETDVARLALAAMGTRFELALCPPAAWPAADAARRARAVGELALDEIRLAHQRLSAFASDSLVAQINRRAGREWTTVDPDTLELLELARRVHQDSGGAFDITLGPLMRAWGFRGEAPDPVAARAARACVGMRLLAIDGPSRRVALTAPGAQLDLGAIAKGHALDLAGAVLRAHGVECALLHAGTSSVLALGGPPGDRARRDPARRSGPPGEPPRSGGLPKGWTIALADRGRLLGPRITLRDQALSVSSPSGRTMDIDGVERAHVLDPRTGAPADSASFACAILPLGSGLQHAGVWAHSCAAADAWSTALLVAGGRPRTAPDDLTSHILAGGPHDAPHDAPPGAPNAALPQWRHDGPGAADIEFSPATIPPAHAAPAPRAREEIHA